MSIIAELSTAQAKVRRLEAKLAEVRMELSDARHSLAHCVPGRKAALAEVERLREALAEIVLLEGNPATEVLRIARSALRGGEEPWVCGVCMRSNTTPRCSCGGGE